MGGRPLQSLRDEGFSGEGLEAMRCFKPHTHEPLISLCRIYNDSRVTAPQLVTCYEQVRP